MQSSARTSHEEIYRYWVWLEIVKERMWEMTNLHEKVQPMPTDPKLYNKVVLLWQAKVLRHIFSLLLFETVQAKASSRTSRLYAFAPRLETPPSCTVYLRQSTALTLHLWNGKRKIVLFRNSRTPLVLCPILPVIFIFQMDMRFSRNFSQCC